MTRGGVPCSRYYTVGEAMAMPYAERRGLLATARDSAGEFRVPNPPFHLRHSPVHARGFVAALGEHNERVLRDLLGTSRDALERLAGEGVLCRAPQRD
jgi:crotonobetainyl-CoA:carnitine CoA-transferase CaiB-like acyl-CoA transferase